MHISTVVCDEAFLVTVDGKSEELTKIFVLLLEEISFGASNLGESMHVLNSYMWPGMRKPCLCTQNTLLYITSIISPSV